MSWKGGVQTATVTNISPQFLASFVFVIIPFQSSCFELISRLRYPALAEWQLHFSHVGRLPFLLCRVSGTSTVQSLNRNNYLSYILYFVSLKYYNLIKQFHGPGTSENGTKVRQPGNNYTWIGFTYSYYYQVFTIVSVFLSLSLDLLRHLAGPISQQSLIHQSRRRMCVSRSQGVVKFPF